MICPNGSGAINYSMEYNESVELLRCMNHIIDEFDWDEYVMQAFRRQLELSISEEDVRVAGLPVDDELTELIPPPERATDAFPDQAPVSFGYRANSDRMMMDDHTLAQDTANRRMIHDSEE